MKKILMYGMILVFMQGMLGFVSAGVGPIDTECRAYGFDFGIAKYPCGSTTPGEGDGSTLTVSWNSCVSVDWTANPAVAGVLSKEGTNTYVHPGGTTGTVTKTEEQDISHITFCGDTSPPAPEFSSLAIAAAILLTTPAFAYLIVKKKG